MRVLMLELAARDQLVGLDERLDHGLVGVAFFALVCDDAFADKTWCLLGERAVLVDGVRNGAVDASRLQFARTRRPDIEILSAVAGRGMHEAGAGIVGDMLAREE